MTHSSPCILLVDDSDMDVELAVTAFQEVGSLSRIQVATSGRAALDYLFGVGSDADRHMKPLPDIILLDLKMPVIDGFEVLRQIKNTPPLRRIPIIILTSSKEDRDRAEAYDTGANSYILKPISFAGFLSVVKIVEDYWIKLNIPPPLAI